MEIASHEFNEAVGREFRFLVERGFVPRAFITGMTAGVEYVGRHVAVTVALDRRDSAIDCLIHRMESGRTMRNNVSGGYSGPLHAFLVEWRRYRGGFREFTPQDENAPSFLREIKTYAAALRTLAPEIADDRADIFDGLPPRAGA